MTPCEFPQANTIYGPPDDLEESQCQRVHAYKGQVQGGSVDGAALVVVAWQPDFVDLDRLAAGYPLYLTMMGGLAPHFITTTFIEATSPS